MFGTSLYQWNRTIYSLSLYAPITLCSLKMVRYYPIEMEHFQLISPFYLPNTHRSYVG